MTRETWKLSRALGHIEQESERVLYQPNCHNRLSCGVHQSSVWLVLGEALRQAVYPQLRILRCGQFSQLPLFSLLPF